MIAVAKSILIIVFSVGISPMNHQVNKPKITVPIPNPANLIFQNAPKCSNDHLVENQYKGAIGNDAKKAWEENPEDVPADSKIFKKKESQG